MEKYFKCDKIVCEKHAEDIEAEEDDYMLVAFSDHGDEPEEYLILQKAYSFDKQDVELGMDSYSLEYVSSDCEVYGYGICKKIALTENEVIFTFKENSDNVDLLRIDISEIDKEEIPSDFNKVFNEIVK